MYIFSFFFFFFIATVLWDHEDEGWDWQASGTHEEVHWRGPHHLDPEWPEPAWGSVGVLP